MKKCDQILLHLTSTRYVQLSQGTNNSEDCHKNKYEKTYAFCQILVQVQKYQILPIKKRPIRQQDDAMA